MTHTILNGSKRPDGITIPGRSKGFIENGVTVVITDDLEEGGDMFGVDESELVFVDD